jgi:hypothetical protein
MVRLAKQWKHRVCFAGAQKLGCGTERFQKTLQAVKCPGPARVAPIQVLREERGLFIRDINRCPPHRYSSVFASFFKCDGCQQVFRP